MPCRFALIRCASLGCAAALGLAACAQPGTQAPLSAAKQLDEATSAISTSCGFAQQMTALDGADVRGLAPLQASAAAGARKLASVYRRHPTDVYQGETVTQIVSDSAGLLGYCGLRRAQQVLMRAQSTHR